MNQILAQSKKQYVETIDGNGQLDTLLLSDAFRRHALRPYGIDFEIQGEVVDRTRQIGNLSTYFIYENVGSPENKRLIEKIVRTLKDIQLRAELLSAKSVLLPFESAVDRSEFYKYLQYSLMQHKLSDYFQLRAQPFDVDKLSDFGQVDKDVKTILDDGLRGVCYLKHASDDDLPSELRLV